MERYGKEATGRTPSSHLEGLCGKLTKAYDAPDLIQKLITVCHKCHYNLEDHNDNGKKEIERNESKRIIELKKQL